MWLAVFPRFIADPEYRLLRLEAVISHVVHLVKLRIILAVHVALSLVLRVSILFLFNNKELPIIFLKHSCYLLLHFFQLRLLLLVARKRVLHIYLGHTFAIERVRPRVGKEEFAVWVLEMMGQHVGVQIRLLVEPFVAAFVGA